MSVKRKGLLPVANPEIVPKGDKCERNDQFVPSMRLQGVFFFKENVHLLEEEQAQVHFVAPLWKYYQFCVNDDCIIFYLHRLSILKPLFPVLF